MVTDATLNVYPIHTLGNIEIQQSSIVQTLMTISAYDQSKRPILGKIIVQLVLDRLGFLWNFVFISSPLAYELILGRLVGCVKGRIFDLPSMHQIPV